MRKLFRALRRILLVLALLLTGVIAAYAGWFLTRDWSSMAAREIEALHENVASHHPGPVDPQNPTFVEQMNASREAAMALVPEVSTHRDYHVAVRRFSNGFQDDHLRVFVLQSGLDGILDRFTDWEWPQFVAVSDGSDMVVRVSRMEAVPVGTTITACDGRPIHALLADSILLFEGRVRDLSSVIQNSPKLFTRGRNRFIAPPQRCEGHTPEGAEWSHSLEWTRISAHAWKERVGDVESTARPEFAVTEDQGTYWISLPTFSTRRFGLETKLLSTIEEIEARSSSIRAANRIVFDLRHNTGGSSAAGRSIARAVWGEEFVADWRKPSASGVDWRATPENLAHVRGVVKKFRNQGNETVAAQFSRVAARIEEAIQADEPLAKFEFSVANPQRTVPPPTRADVFVLTDGYCASACLDFMDVVSQFPNVTHVGRQTSSDTNYIDVRSTLSPTYAAFHTIPLKVYRGRTRPDGGAYVPSVSYDGTDWSTLALKEWVGGLTPTSTTP